MIHHWKGLDLEIRVFFITIIRQPQVKPYHLKPQTLNYVEILKVSDILT